MEPTGSTTEGGTPEGHSVPKWIVIGVGIFLVATAGVGIGLDRFATPTTPSGPPPPVVNASFRVNTSVAQPLPPFALGINARANYTLGTTQAAWINSTTVRLVRWPGGNLSDALDPLADGGRGTLYDGSGQPAAAATSLPQFVDWCRSVGCSSILTLPGEIDNASYAAAIAHEVVVVLGFTPLYWEVGNEPALWTHWGIPWSEWNVSQALGPTPNEYATEVASYVSAVRSVLPSAQFIGLPGVGTGADDGPWIRAVVATDGQDLAAVAIHVYPAGAAAPNEPLASFFATLEGTASIAVRVPADLALLRSVCGTCHIALLVDELGSITGRTYPTYVSGYDSAPYIAAEVVDGLYEGAASLELWNLQSTYPNAWASSHGSLGAAYSLYATFLSRLPGGLYPVEFSNGSTGLHGLAGVSSTQGGPVATVFFVNTNTTDAFRLSLASAGFPLTGATVGWTWASGEGHPSGPLAFPSNVTTVVIPPLGLGLWQTPVSVW